MSSASTTTSTAQDAPPFPLNLGTAPPNGVTKKDLEVANSILPDFRSIYRTFFFPLTEPDTLKKLHTAQVLDGIQVVSSTPGYYATWGTRARLDELRALVSTLPVSGVGNDEKLSKELTAFVTDYQKVQKAFAEERTRERAGGAPTASTSFQELTLQHSLIDDVLRNEDLGQRTRMYPPHAMSKNMRNNSYPLLLERAGLTPAGQGYFPAWPAFHERRHQIASILSKNGLPSLDKDTYKGILAPTIIDTASKLYNIAYRLHATEEDTKLVKTIQEAGKATIEPFSKWALGIQQQAEQIANMHLIDEAYSYLKGRETKGTLLTEAATKFIDAVEQGQKNVPDFNGTFSDTMRATADSLVTNPFDSNALTRATMCNEGTSKWMNKGPKWLLYNSNDEMMSDTLRHLQTTHPDIFTGVMDKLPPQMEDRLVNDMAKQAQNLWELLSQKDESAKTE